LERIYRSVSLLRAETVIPPLKRETDIVIGIGSHLEAGTSLEHLLSQTSTIARRLTLRPAIASHFWGVMSPLSEPEEILLRPPQEYKRLHQGSSVPFMELPTQLPRRLKQLIPYHIALELHCAPVGRDHHCLTVAIADPTNKNTIRLLEEITSLTIFPVSCDLSALNTLLADKW
jgi:hypothetical protein